MSVRSGGGGGGSGSLPTGGDASLAAKRARQDEYRRQLDNPPVPVAENRRPVQRATPDASAGPSYHIQQDDAAINRRQKQEEYRRQLDNPPVPMQESRRPVQRAQDGGGGGGGSDFLPGETETEVVQRRRMKQEEYRRQLDMGAAAAPMEETRASLRGRNPAASEKAHQLAQESSGDWRQQQQQQQQQQLGENEENMLRRMRQEEYRMQLDNPPAPMQESRRSLQRAHLDEGGPRDHEGQLQAQMEMMQHMPAQVYSSPANAAADKRMRQQEYADQLRSDSATDAAYPLASSRSEPLVSEQQQYMRDRITPSSEAVDRRVRQQEYADQLRADAALLARQAPPSRSELLAYQQSQQSAAPMATPQAPMGVLGHEHEQQRAPKAPFSHTPPPARRHPSQMSDAHPLRSPTHAAAAAASEAEGGSSGSPAKAGQMRFGGFAGEEDESGKRRSKYAQYRVELDAQVKEAEARKAAEKKLDEAYFGGDDALALKVPNN